MDDVKTLSGTSVLMLLGRPAWPVDDGWRMRSIGLLRCLLNAGATVDVISFGSSGGEPEDISNRVRMLRYVARGPGYRVWDLIKGVWGPTPFSLLNYSDDEFRDIVSVASKNQPYDLLLVEDIVMAPYASVVRASKRVLDMHNIESHLLLRYADSSPGLLHRLYAQRTAGLLTSCEKMYGESFDLVTVCSENDKERLLENATQAEVIVVPNGVDGGVVGASTAKRQRSLLFVGSMDYHANISAVLYFAKEIFPVLRSIVPDCEVDIVGKNPPANILSQATPSFRVSGAVPDIRPYLERAGVVIAPLLVGGGTRLKILEAMAAGRAVVSTSVGCEGLDVKDGTHLLVADSPDEFASKVALLLEDEKQRSQIEEAAKVFVRERYSWSAIGRSLVSGISTILGESKCHG